MLHDQNENTSKTGTSEAKRRADAPLPSAAEFLALVQDEEQVTAQNPSGYSVYHKYNKSC